MKNITNKEEILFELYGSWSDVDDNFLTETIESRSISNREINLNFS